MSEKPTKSLEAAAQLRDLDCADPQYATDFVDRLLDAARWAGASDVHLQPSADGLRVRWRMDGVLQFLGEFPSSSATNIVARLKVLAGLLTYQTDVPQEGRLRDGASDVEMRISTFPTLHGERAVVRLFAGGERFRCLSDLGLPDDVRIELQKLLAETSGAILVSGPAGSGKTTTLYASLREIANASAGGRGIVTLEDPIESAVDGAAQSQINPAAGFDFATGLRSLMRQDPEVILVGEVRDRETAEVAFQAALTGQLVLSSFHAASAAGAITRLSDMGIAPYLLRSALRAIISQRLARRLCHCAVASDREGDRLNLPVNNVRVPVGCPDCAATGYHGRIVWAEMLVTSAPELREPILTRADTALLEQRAAAAGMTTLWQRACAAVEAGQTSPAEVRRVLGFDDSAPGQRGDQAE